MKFVQVALDVPLAREFDYLCGDATPRDLGQRVRVPFGNRSVLGVITGFSADSDVPEARLRAVETVFRETPPLPDDCLAFLRFCARYYHHPFGQVVLQSLPPGLRRPVAWQPRKARVRKPADAPGHAVHALNPPQQVLVDVLAAELNPPRFGVHLLQGITGSGKTEIYLALAERVLAAGRSVLLLVPEINLTPHLVARVRAHFTTAEVVDLHSQLAGVARVRHWLALQAPGARIIIGTRLAILCPLPGLGLIVVDEEHDASYKQQEGLRYSARDMAVVRARNAGCPVVLGSATPSLESLLQARRGRYRLHRLDVRADPRARPPQIELVDLRAWPATDGLSGPAVTALRSALAQQQQSLVFINRRGYAPTLWCAACAWMAACPRCSGRMVLHLRARQARCHLCGLQQPVPRHCPDCGNADLRPAGEGTQRLESCLHQRLPEARVLRVDADTMGGRDSFAELRTQMLGGQVDVAVGTQMLSKGHDFPALACVVVVNPDAALFSADFRAAERLLAQLFQVAGRAGRAGVPGRVLVQTAHPAHPLFQALVRHDYAGYASELLDERRICAFPPETHQAVLHASGLQEDRVQAFLERARALLPPATGIELFDPVPAPVARIAHKYRWQLLVQCADRAGLQTWLGQWMALLRALPDSGLNWVLDVDPLDV